MIRGHNIHNLFISTSYIAYKNMKKFRSHIFILQMVENMQSKILQFNSKIQVNVQK